MKIPTALRHKPVIVAEDYEHVDGRNAYQTDTKGLSLGLAQWNDRGKVDISAKVWRYTGEKWSRQSEELPLHRVLDLAGLQGDAMTVAVCTENDHISEDVRLFREALSRDGELLGERMRLLASLLKEMGY